MNEYKHANKMKKEKKNLSSPLKASWNQRSKKRARVKTKSPIKAPETMLRQGTKGAPNWALNPFTTSGHL